MLFKTLFLLFHLSKLNVQVQEIHELPSQPNNSPNLKFGFIKIPQNTTYIKSRFFKNCEVD